MLKGYKTMIVNGIVVIFMGIKMLWPEADLPAATDAGDLVDTADQLMTDAQAAYIALIGFVNMVLRAVTTTSIFKKD